MDYGHSDLVLPTAYKIVVAGGFGVGKTTLVGSVSEIQPFFTEEVLTDASLGVDDVSGVEAKTTTTVALDFGRIRISQELMLYLFGTPGQDRFLFIWDELVEGAIGAVVVADTRRLEDSFTSIDYFERMGVPFIVAVNCFDGTRVYATDEVKAALNLDPGVPVRHCDARKRDSVKEVLVTLLEHLLTLRAVAA
ncbi:MAG: ATP-binding protein [Hamadaea sp.]|uniref:GTP-binding protein n=1 Tax=Hamadaea sp. TaxID=2024425 RepID=UPI0017E33714|nr:ATP/GTP-binding protein [Hamadaea sp.]NUT17928.1 ATP-binding protein [Hamadaea sp.]